MAKEGSGPYKSVRSSTLEILAWPKERLQMNDEATTANESSPFHNASFTYIETLHAIKGKHHGSGFVKFTCTTGDEIYAVFKTQGVLRGGPGETVLGLVGGTGACAGTQETIENKRIPCIKNAKKGTYQRIVQGTVT